MSKPVASLRKSPIEVSIWRNKGKYGEYFNVSLHRNYKIDDEWKSTTSMRLDDLPKLIELLTEAQRQILDMGGTPKAEAKDQAKGQARLQGMEDESKEPF